MESTKPTLNEAENGNKSKPLLCEVNMRAYDTWLDPYIGWSFQVVKTTKNKVYFLMDIGFGKYRTESYDKYCFNLA